LILTRESCPWWPVVTRFFFREPAGELRVIILSSKEKYNAKGWLQAFRQTPLIRRLATTHATTTATSTHQAQQEPQGRMTNLSCAQRMTTSPRVPEPTYPSPNSARDRQVKGRT
jgi:hypothetical protein